MSRRGTVVAYIQTILLNELSGMSSGRVLLGSYAPNPYRPSTYPYVELWVGQLNSANPITMGIAGTVEEVYTIDIVVYLGPPDMTPDRAEAASFAYADEFREYFVANPTLGGNVFDNSLLGGDDNLQTYIAQGDVPKLTYRLEVTEYVTRNAAAG